MFAKIAGWGIDRNIIGGAQAVDQALKYIGESGEFAGGIAKRNLDVIKDSVGDCMVVEIMKAGIYGIDCRAALGSALNLWPKDVATLSDVELAETAVDIIKHHGLYESQSNSRLMVNHLKSALSVVDEDITEQQRLERVGETIRSLIALAMRQNVDFVECVNIAYEEIRHRRGRIVDGVFVKQGDLVEMDAKSLESEGFPEFAQAWRALLQEGDNRFGRYTDLGALSLTKLEQKTGRYGLELATFDVTRVIGDAEIIIDNTQIDAFPEIEHSDLIGVLWMLNTDLSGERPIERRVVFTKNTGTRNGDVDALDELELADWSMS